MNLLFTNILFSLLGIFVSCKIILLQKSEKKRGVHWIGKHDSVLTSKFATFFQIEIEKIGLAFFILIFLTSLVSVLISEFVAGYLLSVLFFSSIVGIAFSIYIMLVQFFYVKKIHLWCSLCSLVALIISTASISYISKHAEILSQFLLTKSNTLSWIQIFGVALGTSTATLLAILTIIFLKDFRIDPIEEKKLNALNQLIWFSIVLLITTNASFYIIDPYTYLNSNQLLSQIIILAILLINNAILELYFGPRLIGVRMNMNSINVFRIFWWRQIALSMGVFSIVSWYAMLFSVLFIRNVTNDAFEVVSYYLAIAIVSVILSQISIVLVDKTKNSSNNRVYRFK